MPVPPLPDLVAGRYRGRSDSRPTGLLRREIALSGIGDDTPCTTKGLIAGLANIFDPPLWDSAVAEVRDSVCANWYLSFWVDCSFNKEPDVRTVCLVFTAYMNLAYERKIPEYVPGAHPVSGTGTPYWPAYEGAVAIERVAAVTGIGRKLVSEILYELYWATKSGRVTDGRLIAPWSYRLNEETLSKRPAGSDEGKNEGWPDFEIAGAIRWVVIVGAIGIGAYVVTSVVTAARGVSGLVKGK